MTYCIPLLHMPICIPCLHFNISSNSNYSQYQCLNCSPANHSTPYSLQNQTENPSQYKSKRNSKQIVTP
nr:hypothetical protein Iba_chr02cCG3200 [Ipomoea batatas]